MVEEDEVLIAVSGNYKDIVNDVIEEVEDQSEEEVLDTS
jgi:hypothetical protein